MRAKKTISLKQSPLQRKWGKHFVKTHIFLIFMILVVNALAGIFRTWGATYFQRLVDSVMGNSVESFSWSLVFVGAAIMMGGYIARWFAAVGARYVSAKASADLRVAIIGVWERFPFLAYENFKAGELQSVLSKDVNQTCEIFYNVLSRVANNIFLFLFSLIYMATIDLYLTLVLTGIILLGTYINQKVLDRLRIYHKEGMESLGQLSRYTGAIKEGIEVIKTHAARDYILEKFKRERKIYNDKTYNAESLDAGRLALYNFLNNTTLFAALILLGFWGIDGKITVGQAVAYIYLIKQILVPVEVIFRWMGRIVVSRVAWKRIGTFIDAHLEEQTKQEKVAKNVRRIQCSNISFFYDSDSRILDKLNLDFTSGKCYAIEGKSGSGKTTLLKILLGLYKSPGASYLVDEIKLDSLQSLGVISSSDKQIFSMSLRDNLTMGNPDISDEDCYAIINRLGFSSWLQSLPEGLDCIVSQDTLSGGQQQMISNARAFLSDAPVVILDEPFSAMDSEKEGYLQSYLHEVKMNRIVILTSHRENSLQLCDEHINL